MPQFDGVWALGAFWRVGVHVMPGAILQSDREDVHDRVVQSFTRRLWIHFFWVVSSGADDIVGVVGGLDQDGFDVGRIGGFWVLFIQLARQVDPGLRLVFCRVFFGVGVQDGTFGFAFLGQRNGVFGVWTVQHPGDETVFTFINWHR